MAVAILSLVLLHRNLRSPAAHQETGIGKLSIVSGPVSSYA